MSSEPSILLVSDLHLSAAQMAWVERHAGAFSAVVVAGDLLDVVSPQDRRVQETQALRFLERVGRVSHVVVCSGNHDVGDRETRGERSAGWLETAREFGIVVDGGSLDLGEVVRSEEHTSESSHYGLSRMPSSA